MILPHLDTDPDRAVRHHPPRELRVATHQRAERLEGRACWPDPVRERAGQGDVARRLPAVLENVPCDLRGGEVAVRAGLDDGAQATRAAHHAHRLEATLWTAALDGAPVGRTVLELRFHLRAARQGFLSVQQDVGDDATTKWHGDLAGDHGDSGDFKVGHVHLLGVVSMKSEKVAARLLLSAGLMFQTGGSGRSC